MDLNFSSAWLWVVFGIAALAVSVVKPGKNAQAIRAVAVVGTVAATFWLCAVALGWSVMDFLLPDAEIKISRKPEKPSRRK
ncbi:MAG: hypothetical protein LBB08_02450 [Rickettsiales bacterium]|jgi:hypothetical protein|nr:hypothetical protein [Rickettsiales bacterium]